MRRADGLSTSGGGADAPDLLRTRSLIALKSPTNKQPDGSATRPGGFAGVGQAAESAVEPEPPPDGARDGAWQVEQGGRALGDLPGEECQKGQEDDVVGPSVPFAVGSEVAGPNPIEDCDRDQRDRIAVAPRRRQKRRLPPRALGGGRRGCGGGGRSRPRLAAARCGPRAPPSSAPPDPQPRRSPMPFLRPQRYNCWSSRPLLPGRPVASRSDYRGIQATAPGQGRESP
jgi:hypothetical protein